MSYFSNLIISINLFFKTPPSKFTKGAIIFTICFLSLLNIALFPIGNQIVLARILDSTGQHEAAMGFDMLSAKNSAALQGSLFLEFGSVDVAKPETCGKLWDVANFDFENYSQYSAKNYGIITPNNDYAKSFNLSGFADGTLDIVSQKAKVDSNASLQFDGDKWKSITEQLQPNNTSSSVGKLEARAGFASSVSIEQFFVNLDKLGVSSDKFEAGLNFKYADKTTLSQSQKDAVKTISEIAVETLKTKPKDALSDDTGRSIMQFICSGIQKVEVQAPQTIQFGKDDRQVSTSVRPIVFNMKPDAQTIFTNGLPDLIEKILKDNKFRDFVKNQYPKVQKLGDSLKSLFSDNANFAVGTQKEYYDRVDKAFDSFKKDEYKKTLQDSENSINKNILVTNAKLTYFVSMSSGSFYGYRSEQTVTYTSKYMEGLKSEEKDVLKDGLISKFESFDQYYGDDVKEVVVPDKVR